MDTSERFWEASLAELKRGYAADGEDRLVCLLCGYGTERGVVYPDEGKWYEAERYMRVHIEREHGSVFHFLAGMDKKLNGLTEHQNQLMRAFYEGSSDEQVRRALGIGSASTVRNHRFALREKERQARVFLAMMELLKERDRHAPAIVDMHATARRVDDRYNVTQEERARIVRRYFPQGPDGPLRTVKMREKARLVVLRELAGRFAPDRSYTEKEVNALLGACHEDYASLRRDLVDYGFLSREPDGSRYRIAGLSGKG